MSEETAQTATAEAKAPVTKAPVEKVQLTITGVIKDLNDGLDRKQIAKKYGLNKANATKLFADPKLQHRKVVRPVEEQFVLIDDAPDLKPIIVNKKPVAPKTEEAPTANGAEETAAPQGEAAIQQAPAMENADAKGEW